MQKPNIFKLKKRNKLKQYFFKLKFNRVDKIRHILKIVIKTSYVEKQFKVLSIFFLININSRTAISKQKNICLESSWKRSVQPFLKLHRLSIIENADKLYIPGIVNSKW